MAQNSSDGPQRLPPDLSPQPEPQHATIDSTMTGNDQDDQQQRQPTPQEEQRPASTEAALREEGDTAAFAQPERSEEAGESEPAAPASPPLPQKHTAVTPGPRAARFVDLWDLAMGKTLSSVGYDNFATCFPTIAMYAPNTLRSVQQQMAGALEDKCRKEFQRIIENHDVVRKVNELESLISEADRQHSEHPPDAPAPTPPHTLPPENILRAHMHPHLAHQHSQLSAALANSRLDNESLFAEVQAQRAEMEALLAALDESVTDVDGANALLGEVAPDLATEARRADAEITSVQLGRGR